MRVELHCHSVYSDGTLTPAALAARARRDGVDLLVLTDHDSVSGAAELEAAGRAEGVRTRLGIELNCAGEGAADRVHILGYGFDPASPGFAARLEEFRARRTARAMRIVEKLRGLGLPLEFDSVRSGAHETLGRPHVADALRRLGVVKSRKEAFDRWLASGKPGYVESMGPSPAEAIALIRDAGGAPVLAHPDTAGGEAGLAGLLALGLAGIEARYGAHGPSQIRRYTAWADERGVLAVGGTDFHGPGTGREDRLGVDYDEAEWAAVAGRLGCS